LIEVDILELVMAREKGLKKRVWSDDEKRTICAQALTAGVSVAQVARRFAPLIESAFRLPGSG
jgi:transposase-like protein